MLIYRNDSISFPEIETFIKWFVLALELLALFVKKKNRNKQYIKGEEKLIYDYKNQSFLSEHQTHFK